MRRFVAGIIFLLAAALAYAATVGNLKYDVAQERITVSCVDHTSPRIRVFNQPGGTVMVVDCEKAK